jgi:signal transduction histidine kinase
MAHGDVEHEHASPKKRPQQPVATMADKRPPPVAGESTGLDPSRFRYLSTMSHEMRTPIGAVLGYVELLELCTAGPLTDVQRRYVGRLRACADHLATIVSEVADLAKLESGHMEVEHSEHEIGSGITTVVANATPQAQVHDIHLVNDCDDGAGRLRYIGDAARVRQILSNLLSNAIKSTPSGGDVCLACKGARGRVNVSVTDSGKGIPEAQLKTVFQPFAQSENGFARPYGGTGLGLSVSRQLARLMGGDITVKSEKGLGSTFTLWLPAIA